MPTKPQKKKAPKKSVNRGFTTTSIPKKAPEPEPTDPIPSGEPFSENTNATSTSQPATVGPSSGLKPSDPNQSTSNQEGTAQDEWEQDPDERETQSLAERLRPVSEKEITKQLKIVENEKRFAKGWAGFRWSDSRLQNDILDFARDVQTTIEMSGFKQSNATPNVCLQDEDEKIMQKLATLHGILEGMNFPKIRIRQCLEKIKSLEVEEAVDYLVLNCSNEELTLAGFDGLSDEDSAPGNIEKESQSQNQNLKSISSLTINNENPTATDDANNKTSASGDLGNSLAEFDSDAQPKDRSLRIDDLVVLKPPAQLVVNSPSPTIKNSILERQKLLESEASSSAEDLPNTIDDYVNLKLSIIELSKKIPKAGTAHLKGKALKDSAKAKKDVKVFEDKVKLLQASYAFSQNKADKALKAKLKEMKDRRVAGTAADENVEHSLESDTPQGPTSPSPPLPITAMQSFDDDVDELEPPEHDISTVQSDNQQNTDGNKNLAPASPLPSPSFNPVDGISVHESLGGESENNGEELGLFGSTFEESSLPPAADQTATSSEVKKPLLVVRDMPLPKPFIGKTPQSLLEETLRRIDKFAQPQYLLVSKGSRAIRASVEIKWSNRKLMPTQAGTIRSTSSKLNVYPIQTFTMEDEACRDETQAFNYVATLALFYLNAQNFPTVHRYLPATFRELWGELEDKRKKQDDQNYLDRIKSLMEIAKHRSSHISNQSSEQSQTPQPIKEFHMSPTDDSNVVHNSHYPPMERSMGKLSLMEGFAMRQHMASYQVMLAYRATLPIASYRSKITTAVDENQVILLCGETGCGKSTQLPAFILEHELLNNRKVKIFCTQPRRISAISLAERVSLELGEPSGAVGQVGSLVGYNIRLESRTSNTSRLIYATTGVVLRMLENATDLQDITHLILDEIHERSIDSDFLLIALKTILERRPNLRVILMSATVDAEKISNYMNGCPILKIPGRTFPVTSFFLEDVIELTDYKLDAQSDSPYVVRRGKRKTVTLKTNSTANEDIPSLDDEEEATADNAISHTYAHSTRTTLEVLDESQINLDLIVLLLCQICWHNPTLVQRFSSAILIFLPSLDSIRKLTEVLESHSFFGTSSFQIFPLHSSISNENQSLVFQTPPAGVRKIVIATNIAETGITIPDVTCVIDSGKHKEMRYDEKQQISKLVETFIAKSNVTQRRGRAGRVQEGICFHLFTKHRFETLADNPLPEMLRLSLQDLALRIKIMKIGTSIEEVLLQALDPPSTLNVQRAIASLVEVKALTSNEEITPLGRHLVKLPMDVHMGKLLILGCLFRCLSPALTVAAALNSKSPFLTPFGREQEADAIKKSFKVENSDFLTICKVYNCWLQAWQNDNVLQFCRSNMLSFSNLVQIEELRIQFFGYLVDAGFVKLDPKQRSSPVLHGFCQVPLSLDLNADQNKIVMGCIGAAMFPKLLVRDEAMQIGNVNFNAQGGWRTLTNSAPASIHPSSVNYSSGRRPEFGDAKFLTYFNIMQSKKLYIWESGVVDEKAIFLLCGEADFKMSAQSVIIDRKIKAWMNPKTLLTIKILRQRFQQLFNSKMKFPSQIFNEQQQRWFDMITEAIKDDKDKPNETSVGVQNPTTTQSVINTTVNNKGRMSMVLTPAGRISFNNHNNILPAVESTPSDSCPPDMLQSGPSLESNIHVSHVSQDDHVKTTFYQTSGLPDTFSTNTTTTSIDTTATATANAPAGSVYDHVLGKNYDLVHEN